MPDLSETQLSEIKSLLAEGRKIDAIKRYRDATGSGLKESKDWVDQFQVELIKDQPELYRDKAKGGCFGLVMLGLTAGPLGYAVQRLL